MSERPPDDPAFSSSKVRLRSGEMPFGLYWATPMVAVLSCAALLIFPEVMTALGRPISIPMPIMVAASIAGAIIILTSVAQALRQIQWDRVGFRRRLHALELLGRVSAMLGTESGDERAILPVIAPAVATMLGMKMSCAGVLEQDGTVLHIISADGVAKALLGKTFNLSDLPMTRDCIQMGRVTVINDTRHPTGPLNSDLARKLGMRSMMMIPMQFQGKTLGVLTLGDDRPRHFTDGDLRRAWLWGCQATLSLVNSRMFHDMSVSIEEKQRMIDHRNSLYSINTAIQRPGGLDEILNRIAELAPGPLDVDRTLIWMIADDDPEIMYIGAATSPFGERVKGLKLPLRGSKAESVMANRRQLVIPDCSVDKTLNPRLLDLLPAGSLLFFPLLNGDGKPLGVLTLARNMTGEFNPAQIELARLFSLRAAAAIEMALLYQQTRRDADAKANLLRELNHRVKNNLSGIVTLLTLNPPAMSQSTRQWLNRAIDRIRTMAQAHELFTDGADAVALDELLHRTIRSLSVARPAGVEIKLDSSAGAARLRTERAISLAMVMHELCFNGLVHGLPEGGTLTIRSGRNNGSLKIQVEDDAGKGRPAQLPAEGNIQDGHTGVGLDLVRGLVSRELRGEFSLAPAPGGACATLQIPLLPDEQRESPL